MDRPSPDALATSTAPAHLDLRVREEVRRSVPVRLKVSAVEAGLHSATCPQCGINPAGPPIERTFQYVPPWVYLGFLANIFVVYILYLIGRVRVKGTLGLCADCEAADKRGRRLRSMSILGLIGLPALFAAVGGLVVGVDGALVGLGAGLVGGVVGAIVAHRRTAGETIAVRLANKKTDILELTAGESFAAVLEREAPDALARK